MSNSDVVLLIVVVVLVVIIMIGVARRTRYIAVARRVVNSGNSKFEVEGRKENCIDCKDGGLQDHCHRNSDCACGLKCQEGRCKCPKPAPPNPQLQITNINNIVSTWPPVNDADYYDLYLMQDGSPYAVNLFYEGTVITFENLPSGTYTLIAFSGSEECGRTEQYSQAGPVEIFSV
jgi:hypothetical protein